MHIRIQFPPYTCQESSPSPHMTSSVTSPECQFLCPHMQVHLWQEVPWLWQWAFLQAHSQGAFSIRKETERYTEFNRVLVNHSHDTRIRSPLDMEDMEDNNILMILKLHMGHSMSNQQKKILTPTNLNENWFLHSVSWDINPQWVSAFYVVWLQS